MRSNKNLLLQNVNIIQLLFNVVHRVDLRVAQLDIIVFLFDEAVQKAITPEINVSYFDLLFMKTSFGLFWPLVADHLIHQVPEGSCAIQTLSVLLLIGFCCIVPKVEVSSMTRQNENDLFDADACMITDLKHLWNRKVLEDAV